MLHVFLLNVNAGKNNIYKVGKIIDDYCTSMLANYTIDYVYQKEDTQKIIDKYKCFKDVTIYSVGGDGTLNNIINCIANTDMKLNVIPVGTGNDFYKSLNNYKNSKIDLGKVNDKYFINVASFGIDAEIANTANKLKLKNIKGKFVYSFSIIKNYFPYKSINVDINNVNKLITILTICNGSYYGGGYNIAPTAELNDGLFDVYLVENLNKIEILKLMLKLIKVEHINDPNVKFYKTDCINIESPLEINCNLDGEIIKGKKFDFSINKNAISLSNDELKINEYLKSLRIIK